MTLKKTIIGNWKMFKNKVSADADFSSLIEMLLQKNLSVNVGIAAPAVFLAELAQKKSPVTLFAQNVHWANEGAFTGETSVPMLESIRVAGSLIAHSERRQYFGETNKTAGLRLGALLRAKMKGVLCIGETLVEREQGKLKEVLENQIEEAFNHADFKSILSSRTIDFTSLLAIAYEPVWAIGTGKSATSLEAQAAHQLIRNKLTSYFNVEIVKQIPLLYGGSVNKNNISEFMKCPDIDGALVGGASLVPIDFVTLLEAV